MQSFSIARRIFETAQPLTEIIKPRNIENPENICEPCEPSDGSE
jgi:hypothetical protein